MFQKTEVGLALAEVPSASKKLPRISDEPTRPPEPDQAVDILLRLASTELSEVDFVECQRPRLSSGERQGRSVM